MLFYTPLGRAYPHPLSHMGGGYPPPQKKSVTPLPPTLHSTENLVGPIIFKIGRGGLFCSSARTYASTGVSGERGWSPRPYSRIGRSDRSYAVVGPACDPRGSEAAPLPPTTRTAGKSLGPADHHKRSPPPPFFRNPADPHF